MRDIFFLSCGAMRAPALALAPSGTGLTRLVTLSNTIAVAVRDSGDVALVDAGWSAEACADPGASIGRLRALTLGVVLREKDSIALQLGALGIEPARVKTIVATHLHVDHIGGVSDFPNAEVVCTDDELSAFRGFPRAAGYRAADLAKDARVRPVALDGAPTYGFPSSADLFGDGEVVLLDARGHTRGHVAVAIRTRTECFVHIGDAAYQSWEFALSPPGPSLSARVTSWKMKQLMKTYACIRSCEADPRRPTIVPSHDMPIFRQLRRAPLELAARAVSSP